MGLCFALLLFLHTHIVINGRSKLFAKRQTSFLELSFPFFSGFQAVTIASQPSSTFTHSLFLLHSHHLFPLYPDLSDILLYISKRSKYSSTTTEKGRKKGENQIKLISFYNDRRHRGAHKTKTPTKLSMNNMLQEMFEYTRGTSIPAASSLVKEKL